MAIKFTKQDWANLHKDFAYDATYWRFAVEVDPSRLSEDEGLAYTLDRVKYNKTDIIEFWGRDFSGSKIDSIVSSLKENTSIRNISLLKGNIGTEELMELADAIKNKDIIELELSYNNIGNYGAIKIAELIKEKYIVSISLENNKIGHKGGQALLEVLKNNTNLIKLTLDGNDDLSTSLAESIEHQVRLNNQIYTIYKTNDVKRIDLEDYQEAIVKLCNNEDTITDFPAEKVNYLCNMIGEVKALDVDSLEI